MKMTSIIKTVVAVTAIVTVGKVIYDKVKSNKETETEEVKTTIDEVVEDDEPESEPSIIDKTIDKFNNLSTDDQALVISVAGAVVIGLGVAFVGNRIIDRHYNRSLTNYRNSQEYKNIRNKTLTKYNVEVTEEMANKFYDKISNVIIPSSIDKYITEFMKKDLVNDPENYEYYLSDKLFVDLTYACYFCKILESGLLTSEQYREVCDSTVKDLKQYV